jgi:hypothetical protein
MKKFMCDGLSGVQFMYFEFSGGALFFSSHILGKSVFKAADSFE